MEILYIACGSGSDSTIGGSLARTFEVSRRIAINYRVGFLTTSGGRAAIGKAFPAHSFFEIKTFISNYAAGLKYFLKQLFSYFQVFLGCFSLIPMIPCYSLIYTDTDGPWDILPAIFYKYLHHDTKWIAMVHHMVTLRKDNPQVLIFSLINIVMQKSCFLFIGRFADAIFVLDTSTGAGIKNYLAKKGCRKEFYSVRNGIDIKMLKSVPEEEKKYDACFFGFLRPSKGLYDIVPIWRRVCNKNPEAKLLIIGGMLQIYREFLDKEMARNNLKNNVILTDYIGDKSQAIKLMKQSRIFISPSQEEGWGITIMECLACGLPGVIWNLPSYEKILKGGVIKVPFGRVDKFADEIENLLRDETLLAKFTCESVKAVSEYDWGNIAAQDTNIMNEIIRI